MTWTFAVLVYTGEHAVYGDVLYTAVVYTCGHLTMETKDFISEAQLGVSDLGFDGLLARFGFGDLSKS